LVKTKTKKQRKGNVRKRGGLPWLLWVAIALGIAGVAIGIRLHPLGGPGDSAQSGEIKAAIIDQLALYEQNPQFIKEVSEQLEGQGFTVDVYSGSEVTVDLYQNLPAHGYELVIFRAHAGFLGEGPGSEKSGPTYLFTGENYAVTQNSFGQLFDEVSPAQAFNGPTVFAVNPKFVLKSMKGSFHNTAIIMMGCATARNSDMAEAFVARGASVYIGWSASVCLDYVDDATESITNELTVNRTSTELALSRTVDKLGLDPEYNAHPKYYPSGAGAKTIYELIED
jgi:hypothetical protein